MQSTLSFAFSAIAAGMKSAAPKENSEGWERGDLSYKLRPVQHQMSDVLDREGLKKVLNCSRRIGKSYTVCVKATERALRKEGAQIRFAAATQKSLRKIIHPLMREISKDAPPDLRPIWKAQDGFYLIPKRGSEIHMAGCNNGHEEDLRGTAADLAVVEEAQQVRDLRYVVDDILMPQLLTTGGDLWMIGTPPRTPVHDFVTYAHEAQVKGLYAEYDIYKSGYDPRIIEKFREEAGGAESTTWLREYMCQFVVDKNFAIVPEWKDDYVGSVERDEFFRYYDVYDSMDVGVRDKTAILFAYYDFRRAKLIIEDEWVLSGPQVTTARISEAVKEKEAALYPKHPPHRRVADNDNLILLQDLGSLHGIPFAPTGKDTLEAMVNQVRLWVGQGKVIVHPRCQQLLGCLKYGIWDEKRKKFDRSPAYGHFDALAALVYLIRNVDVNHNPIPATHGITQADHFIAPQPKAPEGKTVMTMLGIKRRTR